MTLQEYIANKLEELKSSDTYKDVKFKTAIDVGLSKNCESEDFITTISDINKQVEDVINFSALPEREYGAKNNNGSKVTFEVLKKRKRKYETIDFFVLYI